MQKQQRLATLCNNETVAAAQLFCAACEVACANFLRNKSEDNATCHGMKQASASISPHMAAAAYFLLVVVVLEVSSELLKKSVSPNDT